MERTLNRLSAFKVEKATKPGLYCDGGGLYLRIAEGGSKQWIFRYVTGGRMHDMGLGAVHTFNLAEAREMARKARQLRAQGVDPIADRKVQRAALVASAASAKTFRQCAAEYIEHNESSWTNPKHRREWQTTLDRYVFPELGDLPVASIDTPLVLKVIKPLWGRIPETASRVRGRIESVLDYAKAHGLRTGDNPAAWAVIEHVLPAPTKGEGHAMMPYAELPAFMARLRAESAIHARCLEFIILTAVRLNEAREAQWSEVDFEAAIWTIPASRMKAGNEHRVPLSAPALAVLQAMYEVRQSDYVFPGIHPGQPIGKNMPLKLLGKLADNASVHGFRATFSTWRADQTSFDSELGEAALAHVVQGVKGDYQRGDLLAKRRRLMDAWADYCGGRVDGANVVRLAV